MTDSTQNVQRTRTAPLLADYLLADKPGRIVMIGSQASALHWPAGSDDAPLMIFAESLAQAEASVNDTHGDPDLASELCVGLLELSGPDAELETQLGRAVRLFPGRLIVYTHSASLADATLFAFGFRKLDVVGLSSADAGMRWFEYRLSHYKQAPNWLNAQFWANPERFDADDDADIYCEPDDSDEED